MPDIPFSKLKDIAVAALQEYLKESAQDLKTDILPYIEDVAREAASYALAAARGDPQAQANLDHLKVQTRMLASIVYGREVSRALETTIAVSKTIAQVLLEAVKAAIL